ncbi:outer membrane protein [Xanthovirga aplysinae]|uniref:outer membrane protein n=1 Tax=Xanthovirga aplysinae TaxID=2529853 RepID=UPI0012BD7402|nr:outer membrane beta-barrel protein [Xanthovirga aplysinae]MTI30532.1 porin family protein [Xanthovirga aplysinae]
MKIFKFFPLMVLFLYQPLMAQTNKGNMLLGGGGGFYYSKAQDQEGHYSSLSLAPNLGYFVADNFVLGLSLPFRLSWSKSEWGKSNSQQFTVGPFTRYYVPIANRTSFFGEAGLGLGTYKYKYKPIDSEVSSEDERMSKNTNYRFGFGLGLVYFLVPNVGLEGKLAYNYNKADYDDEDNLSDSSERNIAFNVGLQVYF